MPITALATAGVLALAAPGQAAAPSATAPAVRSAAAASGGTLSVTVQLAAQNEAAVRALAQARSLDRGTRLRALAAARPSASTATQVRNYLASQGLAVTGSTPYSLQVSGPASTVRALFGTVGTARKSLHLPAALNGLATAAVGGDTVGHPMRRHTATPITGAQARAVYRSPNVALQAGKAAPTIATLQFDGWSSSDLTTFAANRGYPDPVSSKQYTAVSVDAADPNTSLFGGDIEVALDQEALLDTAPSAKQRAYFTPNGTNSDQHFLDALNAITADASNPNVAYHITALSISWGKCEAYYPPANLDALHAAVTNLTAAGVTVFAAAGDAGAYDCADPSSDPNNLNQTLAVDYPASDPGVIGVGGTTVDINSPYSTAAPNETTWWTAGGPPGSLPSFQGNGGGGGLSSHFARPDYQAAAAPTATARNVPDIALDAAPASGMYLVYRGGTTTRPVGGTSLAAPLAAATLTDLLASKGLEYGIGDIHTALYTSASTFRDITSGTNGYYSAGTGYDDASGLGAPDWTAMTSALLPGLSGSRFVPVTPCRVFDTRTGTGSCPGAGTVAASPVRAGQTIAVKTAGANGIPANATAVVLNVTAVSPTTGTYVSVYPTGASRPATSNLNLVAGQSPTPNEVVVPVGAGGKVSFYNNTGSVQLLADVSGYYTSTGSTFTPLAPCRIFDTRNGKGSCDPALTVPTAPVPAGQNLTVQVTGSYVPAGATAVVLNVTGVNATATSTYVSVYPTASGRPATSNLNLARGQGARPNLVIVPLDANGRLSFYNNAGTVDLIADITGYFTTGSGGLTYPVTPCRVFDTRTGHGSCPAGTTVAAATVGGGQSIDVTVAGANGIPSNASAVILNVTAVSPTATTFVTVYPTGSALPRTSNLNLLAGQAPTPNLVVVPIGSNGKVSFYNYGGQVHLLADVAGYVS